MSQQIKLSLLIEVFVELPYLYVSCPFPNGRHEQKKTISSYRAYDITITPQGDSVSVAQMMGPERRFSAINDENGCREKKPRIICASRATATPQRLLHPHKSSRKEQRHFSAFRFGSVAFGYASGFPHRNTRAHPHRQSA